MNTLTTTPVPRADKLYYMFIVEASSRMSELFDGTKTKWDSVKEAASGNLLNGLPSRANFGLIMLGGSSANNQSCGPLDISYPLNPDSRNQIGSIISNQQPEGEASLSNAIDLARDNLLGLPDDSSVKALELFMFLGGGDPCANNDLRPILFFLQNSSGYLTNTHIEVFILSNEAVDEEVLLEIERTNQELQNARVNIIRDAVALSSAVSQSIEQAMDRAREVEPSAVAAQETIAVQNLTSTEFLVSTQVSVTNTQPKPSETGIPLPTSTSTNIPTFTPTYTKTTMPSFTPIPTTSCPQPSYIHLSGPSYNGTLSINYPGYCTTGFTPESPIPTGGTYSDIPDGTAIWELVFAPDGLYYPQSPNACGDGRPPTQENGNWSVNTYLGRVGDPPRWYDIVIALTDQTASDYLSNWLINNCPNFPGIDPAVLSGYNITVKSFITVQTK